MKVLSAVTTLIASLAGSPCGLGLRVFFTSVVGLIMAVTAAQYAVAESSYKNSKAIFSIYQDPNNLPTLLREPGCGRGQNNALSADIGVVEFGDDGSFIDSDQLKLILECISGARQKSPNGVVVLVFVHGWRHDSSWNDENFRDFRTVIFSLALREAERVGGRFRRVVGVYFGWSGGRITEFGKRYQVAQRIGQGGPIQKAIQDIVRTAKEASANEQLGSPVILAGHSIGALMLQTA